MVTAEQALAFRRGISTQQAAKIIRQQALQQRQRDPQAQRIAQLQIAEEQAQQQLEQRGQKQLKEIEKEQQASRETIKTLQAVKLRTTDPSKLEALNERIFQQRQFISEFDDAKKFAKTGQFSFEEIRGAVSEGVGRTLSRQFAARERGKLKTRISGVISQLQTGEITAAQIPKDIQEFIDIKPQQVPSITVPSKIPSDDILGFSTREGVEFRDPTGKIVGVEARGITRRPTFEESITGKVTPSISGVLTPAPQPTPTAPSITDFPTISPGLTQTRQEIETTGLTPPTFVEAPIEQLDRDVQARVDQLRKGFRDIPFTQQEIRGMGLPLGGTTITKDVEFITKKDLERDAKLGDEASLIVLAERISNEKIQENRADFISEIELEKIELEQRLASGDITIEEANELLNKKAEEVNTKFQTLIDKEVQSELKPIIKKSQITTAAVSIALSVPLGFFGVGALSLAPRSISGIAAIGGGTLALGTGVKTGAGLLIGEVSPVQAVGVAGSLIGFGIGGKLGSRLLSPRLATATNKASLLSKRTGIKHKVSQDWSISDAVLKGRNPDGTLIWEVKGSINTKVVNPKTGKVVDKIETDTFSRIVTSSTEQGAIKALANTIATSLRQGGIRKFTDPPKITIKKDITKSRGEFSFKPSDNPQLEGALVGTGESTLQKAGIARLRLTPGRAELKTTGVKAPPTSRAFSNLLSKRIGQPTLKIKKIEGKPTVGIESTFGTIVRTDVVGQTFGVRSFRRKVTGVAESFRTRLPFFAGQRQLIQPQVRRFPKEQLPKKTIAIGKGRSFIPKEQIVSLKDITGFESGTPPPAIKKGPPAKDVLKEVFGTGAETKPPIKKDVKIVRKEILKQTLDDPTAAATLAAEAEIAALAEVIITKPITPKTVPKKVSLVKTTLQDSGIVNAGLGVGLKEEQKLSIKGREAQFKELSKVKPIVSEEEKLQDAIISTNLTTQSDLIAPVSKSSQAQSQGLTQLQSQSSLQAQVQAGVVPPIGIPPTNITPPKTPTVKKPPVTTLLIPEREDKKKKIFGWRGSVKQKGRYIEVTKQPTSRINAVSQAMRIADKSTARSWKVTKTKQKIKPPKRTDRYSQDFGFKFRTFKQKRGKRQALVNRGIERSQFAIDTPGERAGITAKGILTRQRRARARRTQKVGNLFGI